MMLTKSLNEQRSRQLFNTNWVKSHLISFPRLHVLLSFNPSVFFLITYISLHSIFLFFSQFVQEFLNWCTCKWCQSNFLSELRWSHTLLISIYSNYFLSIAKNFNFSYAYTINFFSSFQKHFSMFSFFIDTMKLYWNFFFYYLYSLQIPYSIQIKFKHCATGKIENFFSYSK